MRWFDGQDIGVDPRRSRFNPPYQHIPCGVMGTRKSRIELDKS